MRKFLLPCVLVSLSVPTVAWADDGCPEKTTPELVASLGAPVGWLDDSQTVHQLTGATVLGVPVGYVIAIHEKGKDTIEELDYRLSGAMRKYTERYPLDLRKAFDKAYPGANCASDKVTSCAIAFQSSAAAGRLAGVEMGGGPGEVPAGAHGDGITPVKADYASDDQGPVFLACLYDTAG